MQIGDKASPNISPGNCGQLVKMLITLEPHGIFRSIFSYLYILTLSRRGYAKRWRGFAEHPLFQLWSVSENAHKTWTAWYFLSNFAYLYILTVSRHWNAKRWWGFAEHQSGWSWSLSENAHNSWTTWFILIKFCLLKKNDNNNSNEINT